MYRLAVVACIAALVLAPAAAVASPRVLPMPEPASITLRAAPAALSRLAVAPVLLQTESSTTVLRAESSTVRPGQILAVSGTGCRANTPVTFSLGTGVVPSSITADAAGSFSGSITIPTATAAGSQTLSANCGTRAPGTLPLTVLAALTLQVETTTPRLGSTFTVRGTECFPSTTVVFRLGTTTLQAPTPVISNVDGDFTVVIAIPTTFATGPTTLTAVCGNTLTAALTIQAQVTTPVGAPQTGVLPTGAPLAPAVGLGAAVLLLAARLSTRRR